MSYKKEVFITDFPNNIYDYTRLRNQIKGIYKDFDVVVTRQGVDFTSPELITSEQDTTINALVAAHDGQPQEILIKDTSNANRLLLQEVIAVAADRVDLAPYIPAIVDYYIYLGTTGIMEAFVYFGARGKERLINKIIADATELGTLLVIPEADRTVEQQDRVTLLTVLLLEVTAPDEEYPNGVKAYEYLIGKINGVI